MRCIVKSLERKLKQRDKDREKDLARKVDARRKRKGPKNKKRGGKIIKLLDSRDAAKELIKETDQPVVQIGDHIVDYLKIKKLLKRRMTE